MSECIYVCKHARMRCMRVCASARVSHASLSESGRLRTSVSQIQAAVQSRSCAVLMVASGRIFPTFNTTTHTMSVEGRCLSASRPVRLSVGRSVNRIVSLSVCQLPIELFVPLLVCLSVCSSNCSWSCLHVVHLSACLSDEVCGRPLY